MARGRGRRRARGGARALRGTAVVVAALAFIAAALVVTAWAVAPLALDRARQELIRRLESALHQPVAIGALEADLAPPAVRVRRVRIGVGGEALRVALLEVRFRPYTSLMQMRPVAEIALTGADVDLGRLLPKKGDSKGDPEREGDRPAQLPVFRLKRVHLTGIRVRLPAGDEPVEFRLSSAAGEVGVRARDRRLSFSVRAERLRATRREHQLIARTLAASGTFRPGWGLLVRALDLEGEGLLIRARSDPDRQDHLRAAVRVDLRHLAFIDRHVADLGGQADLDAELEGSLTNPVVRADLSVAELSWQGRLLGDVAGKVERAHDRLRVERLTARGPAGEVVVSGRLGLERDLPVDAEVAWLGLSVPAVASLVGRKLEVDLTARGGASVVGSLRGGVLEAAGRGSVRAPGAPEAAWAATFRRTRDRTNAYAQIEQRPGNFLQAAVAAGPGEALHGALRAEFTDTDAVRALWIPVKLPAVRGTLAIEAGISGTRSRPEAEGRLHGRHLRAVTAEIEALDLRWRLTPESLEDVGLVIAAGGGEIRGTGTVALRESAAGSWQLEIRRISVDWLATLLGETAGVHLPFLQGGVVNGRAEGSGRGRRPAVTASLEVQDATVGLEPLRSVAARGRIEWPAWSVEADLSHAAGGELHALVTGSAARHIELRASSSEWDLTGVRSVEGLSGRLELEAELAGRPAALRGIVRLRGEELAWDQHYLGSLRARIDADGGAWAAAVTAADGVEINARVDLRETGYPAEIQADWQDAHLGRMLRPDPTFHLVTSGSLRAAGPLAAPPRWSGEVVIPKFIIRQVPYEIVADEPVHLELQGGVIRLESVRLKTMGKPVVAAGQVGLDGRVAADVEGALDLRLLEFLLPQIASARGTAQFRVGVRRAAGAPLSLQGTARLAGAAADVGLPFVLSKTAGEVAIEGRAVRLVELRGETAGGRFELSGVIDLDRGPDLQWQVTEISPEVIDWLEAEASGTGRVSGTWDHIVVAGEVEVLRALYDRDVSVTDMIPWFHKRVARRARKEEAGEGPVVELDLHVFASGEIFVDNNFAQIEMRSDLRVRGAVPDVVLDGPVEVIAGEVEFRGRKYEITRGVIEFRRELGLHPYLNITAETVVPTRDAEYGITVQISGTTDDVRVELFSDEPGLAQRDLVSLLAVGKTVAELQQGGGSGVSVQDLLVLAPKALQGTVEKGFHELLPVDRVEIEPTFSRETGAFEPRITVGKSFTEDLSVLVSTSFGVTPERRVQLEYQLTPRISLLGSWESLTETEAGAFGGEFKFRYEFLRMRRYSLLRALLRGDTLDAP